MSNVSFCHNVFEKWPAANSSLSSKKCYLNFTNKSTLSEEICVTQLFLLLEGTTGYNLQRVICSAVSVVILILYYT